MKTPRERLNVWKRELRSMEPTEAVQLLLDIAEQAIRELEQIKGGNNGKNFQEE